MSDTAISPSPAAARPVALVTGGRQGIGRAIVEALATAGFDVAFTARTVDAQSDAIVDVIAARGGRGLAIASDLAALDEHAGVVARVVAAFGRIDCLVNNAGIGSPVRGDLLDLTPENFDRVIAVNLRGTLFFTQAVARWMLDHPPTDGMARNLITVSSVSAAMASPERGDYCVSKAGLAMMNQLFALRLAQSGIGVFELRPGIIRTEMTSGVAGKYDALIAGGLVPQGRWGEGHDIGSIVAALAGGAFAFASGSVIQADGGLSIQRL